MGGELESKLNYLFFNGPRRISMEFVRPAPQDYLKVSLITKSCKGLSRGFHGEEVEFIKEWNEDENSCILLAS